MYLDSVTFPVLVVADDGWVQQIRTSEDLSMWTRSAVMKYNKLRVMPYDATDHAWQIERIVPQEPLTFVTRILAHTLHNPKIAVRIEVRPVTESPLRAVQEALGEAIAADDDILKHDSEMGDLKSSVQRATSFRTLVAELRKKGAI